MMVRIEDADPPAGRTGSTGLKDTLGPLVTLGEKEADNITVPEKKFTLEREILEDPDDPVGTDRDAGLGEMVKLAGVKVLIVNVTLLRAASITETVSESKFAT